MLPIQQELFIFKKSVSQLHSAVYRNLKESDQNYISGVENFISRYNNLQQMTISTPAIASALHTFSTEGKTKYLKV